MKENATSLTLYPKRFESLMLIIGSLLFALGGVWMIRVGEKKGWFVFAFFGLGVFVLAMRLIPGSSYLQIGEEGFEVCTMFRSAFTKWEHVDQFRAGTNGKNKIVVYDYASEVKDYETVRGLMKGMFGTEAALPDTYGKSVEELVDLLNEAKDKYTRG
ncbi:hypothetical protein KC614_02080 [candidate division WWE3 bacterium]|uniref:Uncharacterized protein n=1 Tax=candidate division WWE3 bacterium TaxID=2053526 RepID=A0A955LKJ1_UNCKA|nr:hypothetical protein [candidate division WWE3 bacterium]